jgi:3-phosphoshikimate 1-carboxyvinyltransferase
MPLPDLIEIVPLEKPVHAEITVPGSKSITNRALVLAALADGEVTLEGALWSEDTQVMVDCLQRLGFEVRVELDPDEFCNRTITVRGRGGEIPKAGTVEKPLELFVGNAGTAARFLSAMVCLGQGVYRLSGVPRMHERPQAALFSALRELGYRIDSSNDKLPAVIHGTGPREGHCKVSIEESSQFASALMLCAKIGRWQVKVFGENAEESSYVAMTKALIFSFGARKGRFRIEPDASSGSYFLAASRLAPSVSLKPVSVTLPDGREFTPREVSQFSCIAVRKWPDTGWQADEKFEEFLTPPNEVSRQTDLGDSIMTAIVMATLGPHAITFTDLGRLRMQECERVVALRTELTKCGAEVLERGESLIVSPSRERLHGAEIETYDDHRMAMCFAVLGLKVPGIKLRNPSCVKKTFPNFFQKLAAAPPHGLGATILDGTGRKLSHDELFAE